MLTKEEIIQICRDSLDVTNLTNSGGDTDKYSFKLYFETVADKISSRLDAIVMQTKMEYWCEECKTICAVYEQGLSCLCDNRWETERLDRRDYPEKWKEVKVNICFI